MKKIYKRSDRVELVAAVKRGESVATAARRLWVPMSTAYNWVRKSGDEGVALALAPQPTFVELVTRAAPRAAMVVRVGSAEIEVHAGFDARLLREVAEALGGEA